MASIYSRLSVTVLVFFSPVFSDSINSSIQLPVVPSHLDIFSNAHPHT